MKDAKEMGMDVSMVLDAETGEFRVSVAYEGLVFVTNAEGALKVARALTHIAHICVCAPCRTKAQAADAERAATVN